MTCDKFLYLLFLFILCMMQLEAENRALRLALAKEREVRKCAAALLAGPSTGCPADPKLA